MSPDDEEPLRRALARLRESAAKRESLLPEEKELILSTAAALKARGVWVAELLLKMASAELQLRKQLGINDSDDRWPPIENLMHLIAGSRALCEWPGSDFIYAPTALDRLGFLRQQNDPSVSRGKAVGRPLPKNLETFLWSANAERALWNVRLLVGANRDTEARLARSEDLDRLAEALRFNRRRSGRRRARTVALLVEKNLYDCYGVFHGLLKRGQRETPKHLKEERSIEDFLEKREYPPFMIARLAQELCEHRQRHRGAGIRLSFKDRAALMVADLEGKRGAYGLPEPLGPDDPLEEDTSGPLSVTTRKPPHESFRTPEAEARYERTLKNALNWARARVRQVKALWNTQSVTPKSDNK